MFKLRVIFLAGLMIQLVGCVSTPKNDDGTNQKQRLIKTAKINAQLGIAYLERHNIQRAKQKLLVALNQAPDIPEPWYAMGYFLEATGNKDEANRHYMKAIQVAPKRGDAQNNYGTFLCRNGEYTASIGHFIKAVQDPDYLTPADAYENAGLCAMKIPNMHMASYYFSQAVQQDPGHATSLYELAHISYKQGRYREAAAHLNQYLLIGTPNKETETLATAIANKLNPPRHVAIVKPAIIPHIKKTMVAKAPIQKHAAIIKKTTVAKAAPQKHRVDTKKITLAKAHSQKQVPVIHIIHKQVKTPLVAANKPKPHKPILASKEVSKGSKTTPNTRGADLLLGTNNDKSLS